MRQWLTIFLVCTVLAACRSGCPGHDAAKNTQTIGPGGGVIRLGAASLQVPAGGVKDAVTITVRSHSAPDWPDAHFISPVFSYEPEGFQFEKPAILTIRLSGSEPPPGMRVAIAVLGPAQTLALLDTWTTPGGVAAEISHFSEQAAVWEKPPPACDPPCDLAADMTCLNSTCVKFGTNEHCSDEGETCTAPNERCCPSPGRAHEFNCKNIKDDDNANCGECGVPCYPGKQCHMGYCMDIARKSCSANDACTAPERCCPDSRKDPTTSRCLDVRSDDKNCGDCNVDCAQSTAGRNSHCCNSSCRDFDTDSANCGGCGQRCFGGKTCVAEKCECPTGKTDCGGTCVDLQNDSHDCGTCGKECRLERVCVAGNCECPTGKTDCGGTCVDLQKDSKNCGTCRNACKKEAPCVAGSCECPAGETNCSGTCVDLQKDFQNCGTCGKGCAMGATCVDTKCECHTGETDCGGACVDLRDDPKNCGTCGKSCPGQTICDNRTCVCPEGKSLCVNGCCKLGESCWFTAVHGACCAPGTTGFTDNKGFVTCCEAGTHGANEIDGSFHCLPN
jgi:hypothetical protein